MWICPVCKKENEGRSCTNCGATYDSIQNHPAGECGNQNPNGKPLHYGNSGTATKKNRGMLITCCILSGIGLLLIVILLVMFFEQDDFQVTGLHTISQTETEPVQTGMPQDASVSAPSTAPAVQGYWFETDREGFLAYVRKQLGIPEHLKAKATIGNVAKWEAANSLIVHVSFECEDGVVAGASVDPNTGELARSILNYIPPEAEPETGYKTYHNGRYGYSLEYPSFLTNESHAQNGDGALFSTQDGTVQMHVYGDHMAEFGVTPSLEELKAEYKRSAEYGVHYEHMKNNWFVLSGEAGGNVYYEKHFLKSDGTHNGFSIVYPKSREKEFDPIVTWMSKSFATGIGADSESEN